MKVTANEYRPARDDEITENISQWYEGQTGLTRIEKCSLQNDSDYQYKTKTRKSTDNGKTWGEWEESTVDFLDVHGNNEFLKWDSPGYFYNRVHKHTLHIYGERHFPGHYKDVYCEVFHNGGKRMYHDHTYITIDDGKGNIKTQMINYESGDLICDRDNVTESYRDRNNGYMCMNIDFDENGDMLTTLGVCARKCCEISGTDVNDIFPSSPDTMDGMIFIRGVWDGEKYNFIPSKPVLISDLLSSRGLMEHTVARLKSGRIVVVCRGSNVIDKTYNTRISPYAPSFKWVMYSDDGGKTFSQPAPWSFDNREAVYSSATMSHFVVDRRNGKHYWIGNVTSNNVYGNHPRWPLCIAEVDETYGVLLKDTLTTIDTIHEGESEMVQLSNFFFLQNRENGHLELWLSKVGIHDEWSVWKNPVWKYDIDFDN